MIYAYVKKAARPPKTIRPKKKYLAIIFFSFGLISFMSAVLPIVRYQLEYSVKFGQIISPLSPKIYNRSPSILGDLSTDYTQLSNWFVEDSQNSNTVKLLSPEGLTYYTISIPKLKIRDATVEIGSMDLKKSLIQYPQTALPGQLGNAVVFGHSVLPQFFNPKSYLTIFSTLYRLKQGDEVLVDFDRVKYKYIVEEMYEIQPTDLSVLEQRFDDRYITMITCTPPGTYLRRLVVKARLQNNLN